MKIEILTLLRSDARNWWYHSELRKEGKVAEARKRERTSILSGLEVLRGPRPTLFKHYNVQWEPGVFPVLGRTNQYHVGIGNVHDGLWTAMQAVYGILEPCEAWEEHDT